MPPPPLPPSSRTARRMRSSLSEDNNISEQANESNVLNNSGGDDVRSLNRQYRIFHAPSPRSITTPSSIDGGTTDVHRSSVRSSRNERDPRRRMLSAPATAGENKNAMTNTMTTDEEIERIREMRARRLRTERQERGEQQQQEDSIDRMPSRRVSTPSIGRKELKDAGLISNDHHRRRPPRGESPSSQSRDRQRSDIESRLAARRSQRYSGNNEPSANARHISGIANRQQNRKLPPRSNSSDGLRRPVAIIDQPIERAKRRVPGRTKSADLGMLTELIDPSDIRESRKQERQHRHSLTAPNDISERLRERREARERERKEREKKYGFKTLVDEPELRQGSNTTAIKPSPIVGNTTTIETKSSYNNNVSNSKSKVETESTNIQKMVPDLEMTGGGDEDDSCQGLSIRLCVISAMDLPLHVVPNMPLCPVLKLGLVHLSPSANADDGQSSTSIIMGKLGRNSIERVKSAKVLSTTPTILSKRDNGTVDFHQEYRWDNLKQPKRMGLFVELCARAARTPLNYMESPPAIPQHEADSVQGQLSVGEMSTAETTEHFRPTGGRGPPAGMGVDRVSSFDSFDGGGTRRGFWNRTNNNKKQTQMLAAEAAAAVARMLIDEKGIETSEVDQYQSTLPMKKTQTPKSDYEVTLRSTTSNEQVNTRLTEDLRLGSVVIPLTKLELERTINENKTVRLEQWFQFECTDEESTFVTSQQKKPSVLLEISIYSHEVLDESEDELDERSIDDDEKKESFSFPKLSALVNASFSRRMSIEARGQTEEQETTQKETKTEDPALEQGVVDFLAVVGCKDIGNQKKDDGMKGWVKTTPESVILEQFPPDNDLHIKSGRRALLPEMVQWFCFPEGTRLWRGTAPPSHSDLNLKRFPASSPPNVASSIAAFDACLNCTTSFSWFVIASNSDEYGSSLVKTYGAVIRFYVPAPTGIDPTQDDFAQTLMGIKPNSQSPVSVKRLWVPIGICLTSNLPIIGVMEALLLRLCEEISMTSGGVQSTNIEEIQKAVANITLNYQKPVAGAVNCSIPFLAGDRFLLSLPPRTCLPPLPHGRALVSVCRLLGAEGLNYLLAAVLTECKILFHSEDIADIAMVAEVITALIYPFSWSLPYIPILPLGMIEIVEAPISYMLGIPSCNLKFIEHGALDDTVVVDLNRGFSYADYSQEKMKSKAAGSMKHPPPLPGSFATNVSNAVYKLLHAEEEIEEEYGMLEQNFPRLESESLAEREFRVTIAIEICGLLRGCQDCVGTVFNRDKFLKIAPALYEEKRVIGSGPNVYASGKKKVISTRTKRFLSMLINGQNFQQLLEILESDEAAFFHEVMQTFDESASDQKSLKRTVSNESGCSSQAEKGVTHLMKSLQKIEDKIPTFCVENGGGLNSGEDSENEILLSNLYDENDFDDFDMLYRDINTMRLDDRNISKFTTSVLSTIDMEATVSSSDPHKRSVSMEYLEKLERTPWQYNPLFNISVQGIKVNDKVKLRDAIGDRRFRTWKLAQDKKSKHDDDLSFLSESTKAVAKEGSAIDLTTLITSAKNDMTDSSSLSSATSQSRISSLTPAQERIAAAKGRDIIRRCLDRANTDLISQSDQASPFVEDNGRDLMAEAEKALRNPSAQLFLLSILAQRSRLESKRTRTMRRQTTVSNSASRLNGVAFDCLVRLSCAMLDSCMEYTEFELAYRLLTNSSGFIMVLETGDYEEDENERMYDEQSRIVITMTSRVGLHPIFADLGVWEAVMALHLRDRIAVKKSDEFRLNDAESVDEEEEKAEVEYESAVATLYEMVGYGIPGEELSRFAMRASQEHGWFCDDRGRQLLMLARRISIRRDQSDMGGTGDIDMVRKGPDVSQASIEISEEGITRDKSSFIWKEFGWCHPAAPTSQGIIKFNEGNPDLNTVPSSDDYMKRSAVTALASFGSSMVASGGLDGGVFLAHSIENTWVAEDVSSKVNSLPEVRGIHLDWGSASRAGTGSSSDGEYGVGAVSCLAAAYGDTSHTPNPSSTKDTEDADGELDILDSMEGSRVIAGTTAGDLRVWSVKDIYSSILMTKNDEYPKNGNAATRLKYSLRGRALSGHRGGVTCIDIPSQVYRPDSLVTGGADGSIKLWSLRAPTGSRRTNAINSSDGDGGSSAGQQHQQQRGRGSDALSTLSGHTGRILCIKTAWHGDHLLSGGADRAIRVWDLNGNKCIHRLCGHFGWITNVQYWGPNTIVSASSDRSVALWDARVRSSPLFMLRHHRSPISDLLVGSRTDPYMVSAGADGTIATWDFRSLSNTIDHDQSNKKDIGSKGCRIVRQPSASIRNNHANDMQYLTATGPVHLARSVTDPMTSFLSIGSDAIMRKWDVATGNLLEESPTGHCEIISSFESFSQDRIFASNNPSSNRVYNNSVDNEEHSSSDNIDKGFLTSSLDGTIRMRKLVGKIYD